LLVSSGEAGWRVSTSLPGECSAVGLNDIRPGQRRFRANLRRLGAGHWERKSELLSGKTPGSGGALQVFGLVIGVNQGQALGAQMGALVGAQIWESALSWAIEAPVPRLEAGLPTGFDALDLINPALFY